MIKKLLLATTGLCAVPMVASAADLAVKAVGAPLYSPVSVTNWTGFYVGGSAGVVYQTATTDYGAPNQWDTGYGGGNALSGSSVGGIIGAQVGYNYQMRNFVVGVEGDISFLGGLKKTATGGWTEDTTPDYAHAATNSQALATLRARMGIDFSGTLIYGTAGIGWVKLDNNFNVTGASGKNGNFVSTKWAPAFVAGGGVEHMINNNWSVKGEVLWVKTEGKDAFPTDLHYFDATTPPVTYTHTLTVGRVGLNYKIN